MRAKIRDLSKYGVITDVSPFNLPPSAFTMALNARFAGQGIQRAPVLKRVPVTLAEADPRFLTANVPTSGFDTLIIGYLNGKLSSFSAGTETDVSISGYATNTSDTPYTACRLGDVMYVNREDRVPWALRTSDTDFVALSATSLYTSGVAEWPTTWRCKILRAAGGALCAFGISKNSGSAFYPTMVKTSEFAEAGAVPQDWDETDPNNNATENILAEMEGGIVEAQALGEVMYVYALKETWLMYPDGSADVWAYTRKFSDAGCINANCAVEADGFHYVFGLNDIWRHDGTQKQSICDERVRNFIFNNINLAKSHRCFVQYDQKRKELKFYYVSGDEHVAFSGADGCNRVAVYDLVRNLWTFDDAPFIYGGSLSNFDTTLTYATVTDTYASILGTYLDQEDSRKKAMVLVGDANTTYGVQKSLYAVDNAGDGAKGAFVPYAVDTNATADVTLIRDGIDLDELPDVEDMTGYKLINSIFPQARFESGAEPLYFSFGAANQYNDEVEWSDEQSYDADTYYQCDYAADGRYFSMKIVHRDYHWFEISGYDLDLVATGEA